MYTGESTEGIGFYNILMASSDFTSELGKVALASGKLEAELKIFLDRKSIKKINKKATLGALIVIGEKNQAFDNNMLITLRQIAKQRNYLTHNIYALFTDLIDETLLEKNNLLDTDVLLYIERAWQLKENLDDIADIFKKKNCN